MVEHKFRIDKKKEMLMEIYLDTLNFSELNKLYQKTEERITRIIKNYREELCKKIKKEKEKENCKQFKVN